MTVAVRFPDARVYLGITGVIGTYFTTHCGTWLPLGVFMPLVGAVDAAPPSSGSGRALFCCGKYTGARLGSPESAPSGATATAAN